MKQLLTFGGFIARKRQNIKLTLRELGVKLGVSHVYIGEIERGKRSNPNKAIMQKLIDVLCLDSEEIALLYDLQAKASGTISQDLPEYIMNNDIVRVALREARDKPANDEDWQEFRDNIK